MTLKDQLMEDMKTAMRAHDSAKLDVVRMIRSEVKNFEIDNGEADDAAVQKLIKTMLKQQKDAMLDFQKAARQDLIDETELKISIFASYLPTELSDEELQKIVSEVVSSASNKDFGPLMGQVMKQVGNRADGGRVTALLKQALA
jgi:uncharacterized protein YqeY